MYPFAIINSFGSKIERVYRDFAQRVNKKIFPMLHTVVGNGFKPFLTSPTKRIIQDAANVLELLEEIRLTYGDYVDDALLTKIISENINLLDGWSTSQLNKMISDQNAALGVGNGLKPFPTGGVDKPVVPLIPKKNVVSMQNIPLANNTQRLLQNDAYSKYFFDVEEIINNGIIDGLNADEITKQILDKVDMNAKRARFWAEDQASIFQAEQTRLKAIREGQTHYKWIAGASARPSHAVHNGQIYSWNVGVNNLSRPGARHPGEDYRCHCKIGLATADEIAKAGSPPPRTPQSTEGLVFNYTATEVAKAQKARLELLQVRMSDIATSYGVTWITEGAIVQKQNITGVKYSGTLDSVTTNNQLLIDLSFINTDSGLIANFDSFIIPPAMQGKGFAKEVMKEYLDSMLQMNVKQIDIFANKDVGGYAWAKFGFSANNRNEVETLLAQYGSRLSAANLADAEKTIAEYYMKNPDTATFPMKRLADKKYGKKLLLESSWNGKLDLTNNEEVAKVYKYIRSKR